MIAHIREVNGVTEEQTVRDHSYDTAKYAATVLEPVGLDKTGFLAGLLHDMGKLTTEFQNYLQKAANGEPVVRGSVIHSSIGAMYVLNHFHGDNSIGYLAAREIIAFSVGAHHGLVDAIDVKGESKFAYWLQRDKDEIFYDEAVKNFFNEVCSESEIEEMFLKAVKEIGELLKKLTTHIKQRSETMAYLGLLSRLVLSAVIEGDRRDTCEYMLKLQMEEKNGTKELWDKQLKKLQKKVKQYPLDTDINMVRAFISEQCEKVGEESEGIYRLSVPTGSGKTLSTLRFALSHALQNDKRRVIFIIPLLSVLEQNEKEIKNALQEDEIVFSHHSNIIYDEDQENESDEEQVRRSYLLETWNKEIIVSTMVQFLNNIYKHKTTNIRRMASLVDSIIVIDEVQSVPAKLLKLFNRAIHFLRDACKATIILSTATQPRFDLVDDVFKLEQTPDIVKLSADQLKCFRRSEIISLVDSSGKTLDEMAEFANEVVNEHHSTLLICNTKSEARELFRLIQNICDSDTLIYHLSTSMCAQHRMDVLDSVRSQLKKLQNKESNQKVICVSTQLIEAGVDISFASVIRILAGLDSLAQAAGRCNRSNEYQSECKTYLIKLKGENLNKLLYIKTTQDATEKILYNFNNGLYKENTELLSDKVISDYYEVLFNGSQLKEDMKCIIEDKPKKVKYELTRLFSQHIDNDERTKNQILRQAALTGGKLFEVFDNSQIDIIVPYGATGDELIADLLSEKAKYDIAYMKSY